MATWDVKNFGAVEVSTCPDFPFYEIHHVWGEPYYRAFSPTGQIGGRCAKFLYAEILVAQDYQKNSGGTK